jgi:mRNA interferase MazF
MRQVFDVPGRGDLVWISIPPDGPGRRSPAGRCAAVVLSVQAYNGRVGLAVIGPVSPHPTGYPFEVALPPGLPVAGVVLADQIESVDWRAGRAERIGAVPSSTLEEILGKARALLA